MRNITTVRVLAATLRACFAALLILSLIAMPAHYASAVPIQIGPGTSITGSTDVGTPTNLDRTVAPALLADTYNIVSFDVRVSGADGVNSVVPFLATGSPSTYTTIWVGPSFTPLGNGVHNVAYTPASEQFTLLSGQTVFAGVDSVTDALVQFTSGGPTDHDTNPGLGPIFLGQTLTSFSNISLGRTYSFDLMVEAFVPPPVPEPSSLLLLGLGALGLVRHTQRRRQRA